MRNIEQAIRHALQKVDASDPGIREQIYRAAWGAHEKTLISDVQVTDEERKTRRAQLVTVVQRIETEYYVPMASQKAEPQNSTSPSEVSQQYHTVSPAPAKQERLLDHDEQDYDDAFASFNGRPHLPDEGHVTRAAAPSVNPLYDEVWPETDMASVPSADKLISARPPATGPEEDFDMVTAPQAPKERRLHLPRKHSWFRANIVMIFLLVIMAFVIWSFYNTLTGVNLPRAMPETSRAPVRSTQNNASDWIRVFNPLNVTTLGVRGAASVQLNNDTDAPFFRIRANSVNDAAIIEIGEGVMMKLRGKAVTFNIIARSAHENVAQLSLMCDFGSGVTCGRRRFEVPPTREDLLFHVDIPQNSATTGKLFLTSDLLGKGNEVDIFSVLVQINEK